MSGEGNEVLASWEVSSQYWKKHQALVEKMYAPLTRALIEFAGIASGQSVIDIGGGSGEPSLTIAAVVAPTGHVTYTDPAAGMVKAAEERAQQLGLTNIEFQQAAAEQLPFAGNSFDVAVGRLSSMFFSDVRAALREINRVVKPGGKIALLVWSTRDRNPFFSVITEILNRFISADDEDEDAPGAFRFSRPGKLAAEFSAAGITEVKEHTFNFATEADVTIEQFWEFRTEMSDTFRTKIGRLSPEKTAEVRDGVIKAAAPYFANGRMEFPSEVIIVTGRKPD